MTTAHWAICAVLLFVVGFYVELLVLRLLQALRISQAPKLVDFEGGSEVTGARPGNAVAPQISAPRLQARKRSDRPTSSLLKRPIDLAIAVPAAILLLPLVGLMVLAIKLLDPGPAFYVQMRVGRDGRRLGILKIRSMYVDAERRLEQHLCANPAAQAEWARYFKLRDDPRILGYVGRCFARSSWMNCPDSGMSSAVT